MLEISRIVFADSFDQPVYTSKKTPTDEDEDEDAAAAPPPPVPPPNSFSLLSGAIPKALAMRLPSETAMGSSNVHGRIW